MKKGRPSAPFGIDAVAAAVVSAVVGAGCFDSAVVVDDGVVTCANDDDCADDGACVAGRCFAAGTSAPVITGPFKVELLEDQSARFTLAVSGISPAALRLDVRSPPARGSLVVVGGAELLYTPAPDDHGRVSAELVASDGGLLQTPPTTIDFVIQPAIDGAAIVVDDIFTTEDVNVDVDVAIVDPDGRDCAVVVIDDGSKGSVEVVSDDRLIYAPAADENGLDRIIVAAECDGALDVGSQRSVDVNIAAVDDAPVALPLASAQSRLVEDGILPIALPHEEVDGDPVCFTITSPPARGQLDDSALAAGLVVYVPDDDENGVDSFEFGIGDLDAAGGPCAPQSRQRLTLQIDPVDDAPRIVTTSLDVFAVGPDQVVPVVLDFPDGESHGARLVVVTESDEVFRDIDVDDSGRALVLSPRALLTTRQSLLTVSVVDDRGLRSDERLAVTVKGMPSCGHAKLADPTHPTGLTLLERRPKGCGADACAETFVSFCEQTRRGGGFELVVKGPGSGSELRQYASAWTTRLLNENNPVPDGGAGVLRGARDLPLDDLLVFRPANGFTPAAALDVDFDVDPAIANPSLHARMAAPASTAFIDAWDRNEALGMLPTNNDNINTPICQAGETQLVRFELAINHPQARIGGTRRVGCENTSTGVVRGNQTDVMGLGLRGASSQATRLVFGRSRDFRSITARSCNDVKTRFGAAFIPGLYTVAGVVEDCGSVAADIPRDCNDGAIGPGVEACDDGDDLVANGCSPDCALVFCGDGVVTAPYETCEPGGVGSTEICDESCGSGDPSPLDPGVDPRP